MIKCFTTSKPDVFPFPNSFLFHSFLISIVGIFIDSLAHTQKLGKMATFYISLSNRMLKIRQNFKYLFNNFETFVHNGILQFAR